MSRSGGAGSLWELRWGPRPELRYAALAWALGLGTIRTPTIAVLMHLVLPPALDVLLGVRPYPTSNQNGDFYLLWSLTATLLAASWGAPRITIAARIAACGVAVLLSLLIATPTLAAVGFAGFLLASLLVPAALALFRRDDGVITRRAPAP